MSNITEGENSLAVQAIKEEIAKAGADWVPGENPISQLSEEEKKDPNAVKLAPTSAQTIQPTADVVPLIIKDDAAATANLFDIQTNAGASLVKVAPSGNLLVGNPATTTAKLSVESQNPDIALYAYTSGTQATAYFDRFNGAGLYTLYSKSSSSGYAGVFEATWDSAINAITSGNSGSAALYLGNHTGASGYLLRLQKSGADKFVVDVNGYLSTSSDSIRITTTKTPTGTADASGNTGDMAWDDNYIYVKTSAGWKRAALTAW